MARVGWTLPLVLAAALGAPPGLAQEADDGAPADDLPRTATTPAADEWTAYGGSNLGQRFSVAGQITTDNVSALEQAWEFHTGDTQPDERMPYAFQNTPLKVGDNLYVCSPSHQVFALDPATGEQRWHFDPETDPDAMRNVFSATCRSVAYYESPEPIEQCQRRLLLATVDGRLLAINADDGAVCTDFGDEGTVDLNARMDPQAPGFVANTAGPVVARGNVIVGHQVTDNQRGDAPSGAVRAYDAVTGEWQWVWDAVWGPPDERPPEGETYPRGTPNVWSAMSADEESGLVFLPTGSPANDQWGGDRRPAEDEFTATLVAVEAGSGEVRWKFTTVHHDLWDYDLGAQPALVDFPTPDGPRPAVVQATKYGQVFVLDRATGEPLLPVEERPVPQGTLPGDWTADTQRFSPAFASYVGEPGAGIEEFTEAGIWGMTPLDNLWCRIQFHRMRYEGIFTPPTYEGDGTIAFPGILGGINWGSAAFDLERDLLIVNSNRMPVRMKLYPQEQAEDLTPIGEEGASYIDQNAQPLQGAPPAGWREPWLSPIEMPCAAPPWGFISATDLSTGEVVWSRPLGTSYDQGPFGIASRLKFNVGVPQSGGPVAVGSGLTFIAAAMDNYFRAFDSTTGELLWEDRLPAGGQATPMTYVHEGRQYVVIAAGGAYRSETDLGDSVIAYALPEQGGE